MRTLLTLVVLSALACGAPDPGDHGLSDTTEPDTGAPVVDLQCAAPPTGPPLLLGAVRTTAGPGTHHTGSCNGVVWVADDGALRSYRLSDASTIDLLDATLGAQWPHQSGDSIVVSIGEPPQVALLSAVDGTWSLLEETGGPQLRPRLSPELVVWEDERGAVAQLRVFNRQTGLLSWVDSSDADQRFAAVDGGRIVWTDLRDEDANGRFDGDRTDLADLWSNDDENGKAQQLVAGPGKQAFPALDGDVLVWADWRSAPVDENGHPRPEPKFSRYEIRIAVAGASGSDGVFLGTVYGGTATGLPTVAGGRVAWVSDGRTRVKSVTGSHLYEAFGEYPVLTADSLMLVAGPELQLHAPPGP